jgi:hypothetical protein
MGQNQPLGLSKEEKKELSIRLLREWWIIATQAFVERTSSEIALKALRPYFIHNGRYGGLTVRDYLGLEREDGVGVGMVTSYGNYLITKANGTSLLSKDGGIYTSSGCLTRGASPEVCLCFCEYDGQGAVEAINPEFQQDMIQNLARGYPECKWILHKKGQSYQESEPEVIYCARDSMREGEENDYWTRGGLGEFWFIVTKAFIETSGKTSAMASLVSSLRRSGMNLVQRLISDGVAKERDIELASSIIADLSVGFGMKHRTGKLSNRIAECEINECPFSGTAPELCIQFESFCKGVCEALSPDLEFAYDHMMTKGDKTCHWTIRKKEATSKDLPKEEVSLDDPAKNLALRLSRGEISLEEFERTIASLRKHGLLK